MSRNWLDIIKDKLNQRQFEASADDWSSMEDLLNQQMPIDGGSSASGGGSGISGGISGMGSSTLLSWVVGGLLVVSHAASNYVDPEKFAEIYNSENAVIEVVDENLKPEGESVLTETSSEDLLEEITAEETTTESADLVVADEITEDQKVGMGNITNSDDPNETVSLSSESLAATSAVTPSITKTQKDFTNSENAIDESVNATENSSPKVTQNSEERTASQDQPININEGETPSEISSERANESSAGAIVGAAASGSAPESNNSVASQESIAEDQEESSLQSDSTPIGKKNINQIEEAPSPIVPLDYEKSFQKLSLKTPLITPTSMDFSFPEKVEPLVGPSKNSLFEGWKPNALRASFGYSDLGTNYSLMPEWNKGNHLLGTGFSLSVDRINYKGTRSIEQLDITNMDEWQQFTYWDIGSIDSTWIISGINQGSWRIDTNYIEITDSQQVTISDTNIVISNVDYERVLSVNSYSIPFRYAYRFPMGRWDHRIGAVGSIGFTETISINEEVVINIDRSMRYSFGLDMGTDFYFRPDMAVGLSWNPQYRSFSDAKLEDSFDWTQFRIQLRLIIQ